MRKYMMIFLLLPFITLSASTADSVRLSVTYQVRYANAEGENEAKQDVMKLDIGNSASHFYSWMNRMKEALIDSMNATGQINLEKIRKQVKPYQSGQAYHIYKNIPSQGRLVYVDRVLIDFFKYEEDMPHIEWTLTESDSTVAGYRCQSAVGELRGHRWHVWFTADIPIADGPWKLCGLPGLILKAADETGTFSFACTAIEKGDGRQLAVDKQKYVDCTPLELQDIYKEYFANIKLYMEKVNGVPFTKHYMETGDTEALRKKPVNLMETYRP